MRRENGMHRICNKLKMIKKKMQNVNKTNCEKYQKCIAMKASEKENGGCSDYRYQYQ